MGRERAWLPHLLGGKSWLRPDGCPSLDLKGFSSRPRAREGKLISLGYPRARQTASFLPSFLPSFLATCLLALAAWLSSQLLPRLAWLTLALPQPGLLERV